MGRGVFCDKENEYVVELVASSLGLAGSIPDTTIGKLTKLRSLDLGGKRDRDFSEERERRGDLAKKKKKGVFFFGFGRGNFYTFDFF
jgi:hypothetical protein